MFAMFNSIFSAITTFFKGVESYSSAFAKTGEVAEQRVQQWADEQTEADRVRLTKQLPEA